MNDEHDSNLRRRFAEWREHARGLIQADIPPDRIAWSEPGGVSGSLFSQGDRRAPLAHAMPRWEVAD